MWLCGCECRAGRLFGADMDKLVGNGGSWLRSYCPGEGRISDERLPVELRMMELSDVGERTAREPGYMPCGVVDVGYAAYPGCTPELQYPVGVYGGIALPEALELPLVTPDDNGLSPSCNVLGGVSKLPTLARFVEIGEACVVARPTYGWNFWCRCDNGGGGSSKLGRLEAADLLAVKLEGAASGSFPGCI